jgi:hypothetical protein
VRPKSIQNSRFLPKVSGQHLENSRFAEHAGGDGFDLRLRDRLGSHESKNFRRSTMSAFKGNLLQNYFEGVARATLIQDQMKTSNVDSWRSSIGFDCCAIAMRQRVLQHIQG